MQIKRIGKYKSAGDQLLRSDMSEAQKEQLDALLDGLYGSFLAGVSQVSPRVAFVILVIPSRRFPTRTRPSAH